MKKIISSAFIIILFSSFSYVICNKSGIKRTWLTSQRQFAGIISINEDGTKSKGSWINRNLYLEVDSTSDLSIDSVAYDGSKCTISVNKLQGNKFELGKLERDSSDVFIEPKDERCIIHIAIENMDINFEDKKYTFIIYGKKNLKQFEYKCNVKNNNLLYYLTQ